jgi:hypothetical protein
MDLFEAEDPHPGAGKTPRHRRAVLSESIVAGVKADQPKH